MDDPIYTMMTPEGARGIKESELVAYFKQEGQSTEEILYIIACALTKPYFAAVEGIRVTGSDSSAWFGLDCLMVQGCPIMPIYMVIDAYEQVANPEQV